jgi:hypothetical protein
MGFRVEVAPYMEVYTRGFVADTVFNAAKAGCRPITVQEGDNV